MYQVVFWTKHLKYVQLKIPLNAIFLFFFFFSWPNEHILFVHVSCVADIDESSQYILL